MINRKKTRKVIVGDKVIGGDSPILVQSMSNKKTKDIKVSDKDLRMKSLPVSVGKASKAKEQLDK